MEGKDIDYEAIDWRKQIVISESKNPREGEMWNNRWTEVFMLLPGAYVSDVERMVGKMDEVQML